MKRNNIRKPLFFVFTCIKDGNQFISKLFDSMLKQTTVNFVHYIYEDGSSIPLGSIVEEYRDKASKLSNPFEVIYECNQKNIGLNKSTQHCISKCNCPYFIWIDCDNYIDHSFFEEMEKLYKKSKNPLLLRSVIYNVNSPNIIRTSNCGTIKEAKSKFQIGLFLRRKYYYSFFAVNFEKYKIINPKNIMVDNRSFYNDEQILILCLLNCEKAPLSLSAKGFFLTREGQESSVSNLSLAEIQEEQLKLCHLVNSDFEKHLSAMYEIKYLYDEFFKIYKRETKKSLIIIKSIKKISRKNNIMLKNYYDHCLLKQKLRVYYWCIKRKIWKN